MNALPQLLKQYAGQSDMVCVFLLFGRVLFFADFVQKLFEKDMPLSRREIGLLTGVSVVLALWIASAGVFLFLRPKDPWSMSIGPCLDAQDHTVTCGEGRRQISFTCPPGRRCGRHPPSSQAVLCQEVSGCDWSGASSGIGAGGSSSA